MQALISAMDGDMFEVIAFCNIGGQITETLNVVVPDTIPPLISIHSPVNGTEVTTPELEVFGNATDNIALNTIEVQVNESGWQNVSVTTNWSANVTLNEGENTITARATDTSGNIGFSTIIVHYNETVPLDTTPPTIQIITRPTGASPTL